MKPRKGFAGLVVLFVLLFAAICCSAADMQLYYDGGYHTYTGNIFTLKVNGKKLTPPMPPIVFRDYSLVPARAVFQDGLGAAVNWNGNNQTVTVTMGTTTLVLTINQTQAVLNGKIVTMPIAPKIINDCTMIPARFVGENLGMNVEFDSKTDTISLTQSSAQRLCKVTGVTFAKTSSSEGLITIQTDTDNPSYSEFILQDPMRLVVDVTRADFSPMPSTIEAGAGNLQKIRFGQNENARIVADLSADLGYKAWVSGKNILVSVVLKTADGGEPTTDNNTPSGEPAIDVMQKLTYGNEGSRDYLRFTDIEKGEPSQNGATVTIPIYGNLPQTAAEKEVSGLFGQKLIYTPGDGGSGTITVSLRMTDVEFYVQDNEVRFKSVHKALPRSVTLDAGHGGQDSGAVGYNEDGSIRAKEKDFNLDVALRAQRLLEAQGVQVHMIRTTDTYVDYQRVGSIANDAGTTLFVSVHTNSATVEQAHGIETYGFLEGGSVSNGMTSGRLSQILLEELLKQTGAYKRGVKDGSKLAVVRTTKMPATLIEIGFISNAEECGNMMAESYRQKLAQAVCDGVLRAFDEMEI